MNNTTQDTVHEEHPMFYEIFWQYILEIYEFFRYIFYGAFHGEEL